MEVHRRGQRGTLRNGDPSNGSNGVGLDGDAVENLLFDTNEKPRSQTARFYTERNEADNWSRPSAILLAGLLACFLFIRWHFYWTPNPDVPPADKRGMPLFSETIARGHIKHLSETIGFRLVGTKSHVEAIDLVRSELERIADEAKTIAGVRGYEAPEMEIEVLYGTGSHRFDIAGKVVHKLYQKIPSVIARISCGPTCDGPDRSARWSQPSILLNSHIDTNYASQGAADAASGIAIMLEVARMMMHSPLRTQMKNPVVLLFNGAEESLQDASHAFLFSSPHNKSAKALINMEACGQGGREALFQANSYGMAEGYKKGAKWYHGSSLANDVFGTGLVLSDTDFRQFVQYSDSIVGVDMAYYTNSYVYHTMKDAEHTMGRGSIRHFGDNVAGMTIYLSTKADLMDPKFERGTDFLHFDFLGSFVLYTWTAAYPLHLTVAGLAFWLFYAGMQREFASVTRGQRGDVYAAYGLALVSVPLSLLSAAGAVASINVVYALFGVRPLVWFGRPYYPFLLFGPAALTGFAFGQWACRLILAGKSELLARSSVIEKRTAFALLCWFAFSLLGATIARVGSSFLLMFDTAGLLVCTGMMHLAGAPNMGRRKSGVIGSQGPKMQPSPPLAAYFAMMLVSGPITMGYAISLSELFVPLLARIGHTVPADGIAAGLGVVACATTLLFYLSFLHRFGERHLRNILVILVVISMFSSFIFSRFFPFDEFAPKRLYIQHRHNVTSNERYVDVAHADTEWIALDEAVRVLERDALGVVNSHSATERFKSQMEEDRAGKYLEFESLHPFNYFLATIRLPATHFLSALGNPIFGDSTKLAAPEVQLLESSWDPATKERKVKLEFRHPGLISCTASLGGDVIAWDLDSAIPEEGDVDPWNPTVTYKRVRHVIRTVGGFDQDVFTVRATIKQDSEDLKLRVDFWAMDRRTWGSRSGDFGVHGDVETDWEGGRVLQLVRRKLPDWTAPMLLASVGGVWWL